MRLFYPYRRLATLAIGLLYIQVQSQAAPTADGNLSIATGNLTFDSISLAKANQIVSFSNIVVGQATGVYGGLTNATLVWTPFWFNPPAASVKPLWACTNKGIIYSFDATSVVKIHQDTGYLNLQGTGVAHVTGYQDTPGTWALSALSGPLFTFSASIMVTNRLIPKLTTASASGGQVVLTWNSVSGQGYQVQYATNTPATNWQNLGLPVTATNSVTSVSDTALPAGQRFYRVLLTD